MSKDLYKILGISPGADEKEIRTAYRKLARRYHPDTGAGSSEERFREIQDAYNTIGDPAKRAAYDQGRRQSVPDATPAAHSGYSIRVGFTSRPDPSHLDLSDIFGRPKPESIVTRPLPHAQRAQFDSWADLEALLRLFERFDESDY